MTSLNEFNRYGEEIEKLMLLRTSPIAVKMLEKESDIPAGAMRPIVIGDNRNRKGKESQGDCAPELCLSRTDAQIFLPT